MAEQRLQNLLACSYLPSLPLHTTIGPQSATDRQSVSRHTRCLAASPVLRMVDALIEPLRDTAGEVSRLLPSMLGDLTTSEDEETSAGRVSCPSCTPRFSLACIDASSRSSASGLRDRDLCNVDPTSTWVLRGIGEGVPVRLPSGGVSSCKLGRAFRSVEETGVVARSSGGISACKLAMGRLGRVLLTLPERSMPGWLLFVPALPILPLSELVAGGLGRESFANR